MNKDLNSLVLEVPEKTKRKDLVDLLKRYSFSIAGDHDPTPQDRGGKKVQVYVVQGPESAYEKLKKESENKGYHCLPLDCGPEDCCYK